MLIVQKITYKYWSWYGLSQNPNITWKIIKNNLDKPWDWQYLSYNKFTSDKQYYKWNYGKNWKWLLLCEQKDIIMIYYICKNFDMPIEIFHMIAKIYIKLLIN